MSAVAIRPANQTTTYTGAQLALIKRTVAKDTNGDEFDLFMAVAGMKALDPFSKQIAAIVFNKNKPDKRNMSIITTIDGMRAIAARSGRYRPDEDEPDYTVDPAEIGPLNPKGLVKAKVKIWIADSMNAGGWKPATGVAYWEEFAPIKDEWAENDSGKFKPTGAQTLDTGGNWGKMPRIMLAKCFDAETEVLTAGGFQRFAEVNSPILQVTDGGLEPVAATPFVQAYSGPMVTLDSDDLNFSVTPNHDMVTTSGKIEAGALYEAARARAMHFIPRHPAGCQIDAAISDEAIRLTAAYVADGFDRGTSGFAISVSRPAKVARLREWGLHHREAAQHDAGKTAQAAGRTITTKADKARFEYEVAALEGLAAQGKVIDLSLLGALSRRQARLLVDTLVQFDGHTQAKNGVRRFYTSRPDHMGAFETAAVMAGYAVSDRKSRTSDISPRPNLYVTISDRDAIGVVRWGRDYNSLSKANERGRTGLALSQNVGGEVWCVTVPSGAIVVRRHGFSMVCGNCAEAQALRKAFPEDLSGLYEGAELDRAQVIDLTATEIIEGFAEGERLARIGGPGITMQFSPNQPLESVPLGKLADRIVEAVKGYGGSKMLAWFESANMHPLREFWAHSPGEALEVKKVIEAARAKLAADEAKEPA